MHSSLNVTLTWEASEIIFCRFLVRVNGIQICLYLGKQNQYAGGFGPLFHSAVFSLNIYPMW